MVLPVRFWDKVQMEPNSGCWLWDASCNNGGYARFCWNGRTDVAHRVSYEAHNGPIPDGLDLDHLCRVRCCVNPDHLEPVTRQENVLRGLSPGRIGQYHRTKTHCPNGHPYEGENLYIQPNGWRICRQCKNANKRKYRQQKKALDKCRVNR